MSTPHVSIITATYQRYALLSRVINDVRRQALISPCGVEHIVVADGPDERAAHICRQYKHVKYDNLPKHSGLWGASCKDRGLQMATGNFVCFWDDDNLYHPFALATLFGLIAMADIGIARVQLNGENLTVPRSESPTAAIALRSGDIDSACFIVRREIAVTEKWADHKQRDNDFNWISRIAKKAKSIAYVPVEIAVHL